MKTARKWQRGSNGEWLLLGTMFSVLRDKSDGTWDVCERSAYLCTTRYVDGAKRICERLSIPTL